MSRIVLVLLVFLLLPFHLRADTIAIDRNLSLRLEPPGGDWTLTKEAPSFLLEETVEHLRHELAGKNKAVPEEKILEAARRRLQANEAYLCQSVSGACLVIDFSPLRPGETPPSARSVKQSAKYAAEGLEEEEGISGVKHNVRKIVFPGAASAYRIDASYRQHGTPSTFKGIVGFAGSHWFYLYYTDRHRNLSDAPAMDAVLQSAALVRAPQGTK